MGIKRDVGNVMMSLSVAEKLLPKLAGLLDFSTFSLGRGGTMAAPHSSEQKTEHDLILPLFIGTQRIAELHIHNIFPVLQKNMLAQALLISHETGRLVCQSCGYSPAPWGFYVFSAISSASGDPQETC